MALSYALGLRRALRIPLSSSQPQWRWPFSTGHRAFSSATADNAAFAAAGPTFSSAPEDHNAGRSFSPAPADSDTSVGDCHVPSSAPADNSAGPNLLSGMADNDAGKSPSPSRTSFSNIFGDSDSGNKNLPPLTTPKLFVSGLSRFTTEEKLKETFDKHGRVVEAKLIIDKVSGRSKGFGFVTYKTIEDAEKAREAVNATFLDGWVIFVDPAKPRESRPPREPESEPTETGFRTNKTIGWCG